MVVRISIVVPCFNGERFIGQAIASVLAQQAELEVVVVDDGSADGSAAIVEAIAERDRRVKLLRGPNRGVSNARNTGFQAISPTSRFVMFLDADDVLTPDAIEVLHRRLERDPTLCAVVGSRSRIDSAGNRIEGAPARMLAYYAEGRTVRRMELGDRVGYWHMLPVNPISTPGQCLLRVSDLPRGNTFDERYSHCEDWDLWLRLTRRLPFGVEHHEVLSYRIHDSNWSEAFSAMHEHRALVLRSQLQVVAPEERDRLRAAWRFSMFRYDASLCFHRALEGLATRDVLGGARYFQRALRYEAMNVWAIARGAPHARSSRQRGTDGQLAAHDSSAPAT